MEPALANINVPFHLQVDVQGSGQKRKRAEYKSHYETDQIEEFPTHKISSVFAAPFVLVPVSGLRTCRSRSASPGVSKIAPSNTRQPRESACLASNNSACFTWGSRRKRSAPAMSHRSSCSSRLRTSEINSV